MSSLLRTEPEAPAALAFLRIAVAGIVITSPEVWSSMAFDAVSVTLRTPPEGLAWFAAHVPVNAELVTLSRVLVVATGVSGLVGFNTRVSFAALSAESFYLFGSCELVGAARHNMHLFWFTALLAVSPCASRWSIDAALGRTVDDACGATVALWIARALLAIVYFFPGYWKLREAGLDWAMSDNLRNQMYWKWFQNAWIPFVRIDRCPTLLRAGAASVMLLELGFPILVLSRRGRHLAAAGGLGFHLFADVFMRLGFSSLWWCYGVLVDAGPLVAWLHDEPTAPSRSASCAPAGKGVLPLLIVGALLVGANATQGFRGAVQAWPFACYPTFQYEAGSEMPDLIVTVRTTDGAERDLYAGTRGVVFRDQRDWGMVWKLLGVYGGGARTEGLLSFYEGLRSRGLAASPPASGLALRFYRADFSVLPQNRGRGPVRRALVGETPLTAPGT